MTNEPGRAELERQLADAHTRIREMIAELQRRIEELEQAGNSRP
jgi:hypothetical protein